jgi:hypothetical protein
MPLNALRQICLDVKAISVPCWKICKPPFYKL